MDTVIARGRRIGRAAALAVALLLSAGCATKRDIRDLRSEMRAMVVRQDSILMVLARQSAVTQDTLRRQTDRLFEIRGDVSRQLQTILDELATLRELTGQNQRTIAALRDQLEGLRAVGGGGGAQPPPGPGGGESVVGGQPGPGDPGAAEGTYAAAVQQYQRQNLAVAQRAFRAFLEQYANHELAPEARWYLADILEQQGETREAIDAFEQIPELHPGSGRVPDALYRMALLHIELGNRAEARRLLDRVVNTYPDSNSAGPARERLRELR